MEFNIQEMFKLLEEEKIKMNTPEHIGRYIYEHQLLKEFIFDPKFPFPEDLDSQDDLLYSLIANLYIAKFDMAPPYKKEDFSYELIAKDGAIVYQMNFPKPQCSTECLRGYAIITNQDRYYFTVEYTVQHNYVLCRWNAEGQHSNYGEIDPEQALEKALYVVRAFESE